MEYVKKSQTNQLNASLSTTILEYVMNDVGISGAVAIISDRYPEKGFAVNRVCKELVYIIEGKGHLGTVTGITAFKKGDSLFIDVDEKFYWKGNFSMYMVTTPRFNPNQHIIVE